MFIVSLYSPFNKIEKISLFQLNAEITDTNKHLLLAKDLLNTFYSSNYDQFMRALAEMEQYLMGDRYMRPHYQFYSRAMRVRAYQQFLTPYKTVRYI